MHELKTQLRRRARPASPPRERRECSRRASREPSRPKRSEQTAGRARAPQTELFLGCGKLFYTDLIHINNLCAVTKDT